MGRSALRITVAAVAAVVVAEAAAWALSPRADIPEPVEAEAERYFEAGELERAEDFASGRRALFLAGLAVQLGVLGGLAVWRPRRLRRALDRAGRRPLLGAAAVGATLSLALALVGLPLAAWAHQRAVDVGLATQGFGVWLGDVGRSAAVDAVLAALGGVVAIAMVRRFRGRWWLPGTGVVVAFAVIFSWLAPVVVAPIFNDFSDLPPGKTRAMVLELGERADVEIGDVLEVDASRRSTGLNAYVGGLGSTKRVVLYDNLLSREDPATIRSVVAHELGHVVGDDIWRGIAFVAISAPLAVLWIQMASTALARRRGDDPAAPAALPAIALCLTAATLVIGVPGQQLSRRVEARADEFALRLTGDPRAFTALQQSLAKANISDPDPPAVYQLLFGSHPTTMQRIGAALAFRRGP